MHVYDTTDSEKKKTFILLILVIFHLVVAVQTRTDITKITYIPLIFTYPLNLSFVTVTPYQINKLTNSGN